MSKLTVSLASIGAFLSAAQAVAVEIQPLFTLAAQTMESLEANSTASGPDKKTAVLNIVGLVATDAGKEWSTIAADISTFVDTAKTLYNDAVSAATKLTSVVAGAAQSLQQ